MGMTNAERQRRYRARRSAGAAVRTFQRPKDRRPRPKRWADAVDRVPTRFVRKYTVRAQRAGFAIVIGFQAIMTFGGIWPGPSGPISGGCSASPLPPSRQNYWGTLANFVRILPSSSDRAPGSALPIAVWSSSSIC